MGTKKKKNIPQGQRLLLSWTLWGVGTFVVSPQRRVLPGPHNLSLCLTHTHIYLILLLKL